MTEQGLFENLYDLITSPMDKTLEDEVRSLIALVIEDIAIKIENRCRELLHDTEWVGYEIIILCAECQSIIEAVRAPRGVGE
jgi:hypothetical protein